MQKIYLDTKVKHIMENMIFQILCERPENPALFMIKWLQKSGGYNSSTLTKAEEKELIKLREEVKKYRENEELKKELDKEIKSDSFSESDKEDSEQINIDDIKKTKNFKQNRRGISAEVYGQFNQKEQFEPKVIPKTDGQYSRIKNIVLHSFLFNSLDNKDLSIVINAMEEVKINPGQIVIKQGDKGDCLYIVDKGELTCSKVMPGDKKETFLKTYVSGETFGELALLYNAPRAASIKAKTASVLFKLDRETFCHIVSTGAKERREKYEQFLRKLDLFSTLNNYEIMTVSEALRKCDFRQGEFVIREGEVGNCFYIIEEGEAVAFKKTRGKRDLKYRRGDFFGELALVKDQPRQANVQATTDLKLLSLDRESFKRIMGPISEKLKTREEIYKKYCS